MQKKTPSNIDPREAEILRAYMLGQPREFLLAHPETKLHFWQNFYYQKLLKKRAAGIPLAYLLGHKEFFGLDFVVNKHTLIPRPETEMMVEATVEKIKNQETIGKNDKNLLIDVGTGSGCIPISVIKTLEHKNFKTIAVDVSRGALHVAKKNAKRHSVTITFLQSNLLTSIPDSLFINLTSLFITANLPYLSTQEFAEEKSIQHEPKSALVAAENGLALYRELLIQTKNKNITVPIFLFLEINPHQTDPIKKIIAEHFPTAIVEIKTDLALRDRLVIISLN